MRLTGYVLIVLGSIIALYVLVTNLIVNYRPAEAGAGPVYAVADGSNTFWFALIPAVAALIVGIWLALRGGTGYRETYDMRKQQT
jgi:hypothetical protein